MASGLLILVAGPATKLMEVYQAQTKKYSGTIRLGETTPSFDIETEVRSTLVVGFERLRNCRVAGPSRLQPR